MAATQPFRFQSTASITRYTGISADNPRALLKGIQKASGASIFYHVFHALFRRHYMASEYMNDFARWAWSTLHEPVLAEKLAAVDPAAYTNIHEARGALARVLSEQLGNTEFVPRVPQTQRFYFAEAQTFIFPVGLEADDPNDFAEKVGRVPPDVIFHHFVAAPIRLGSRENDFSVWLRAQGATAAAERLEALSPYASDLYGLRTRIAEICRH